LASAARKANAAIAEKTKAAEKKTKEKAEVKAKQSGLGFWMDRRRSKFETFSSTIDGEPSWRVAIWSPGGEGKRCRAKADPNFASDRGYSAPWQQRKKPNVH